jgi:transcriptional regulator with XRE-family HTH domain
MTRRRSRLRRRRPRYDSLAAFLKATGLRQEDLAALAGTTQATISRIVRGTVVPKRALAARLAERAHVPMASFYVRPSKRPSASRVA